MPTHSATSTPHSSVASRKHHVTTTVNGQEIEFLCESRQSLLEVLRDQLRLTVNGRTFTMDEAGRAEDVHWDFGTAMIVTVLTRGGLKPGSHKVEITLGMNPSYVPPNLFRATGHKRITLVV